MSPNSHRMYLHKRETGSFDYTEEEYVTTEAEIGILCLQAKQCQGVLATPEAERKVWDRFSF